jgi:hypothetical protein
MISTVLAVKRWPLAVLTRSMSSSTSEALATLDRLHGDVIDALYPRRGRAPAGSIAGPDRFLSEHRLAMRERQLMDPVLGIERGEQRRVPVQDASL